ncbi:hypothetical protein T492DRAFT_987136 [Pavlovales sp. CCMP2436]|nr:hypothetical protein T492DRAFT_987136 [Pavlovales sp. CCMP2436]
MYQCNQAKRAWEDANSFTYDVVMKMRPDYVCGGSSWASLKIAIRNVLLHQQHPEQQPYPFFHEHSWPTVMVSDKFAVGTSRAMDYYMDLVFKGVASAGARTLFFMNPPPASFEICFTMGSQDQVQGVHMGKATFDHMQTFCCQSPGKHRKQGRCRRDFAKGGVMERYFHASNRTARKLADRPSEIFVSDGSSADEARWRYLLARQIQPSAEVTSL